MEEAEVPLEHLHEHVKDSAEHSGEAWISVGSPEHCDSCGSGRDREARSLGQHANEAMMNQIEAVRPMELLPGEKYQGLSARCKNVAQPACRRIGPIKSRSLRERAGKDKIGSRAQASRSEIIFSQARSVRAWRDHVPNRNCHRGDLRAHKETLILGCESDFWRCWLCVSRPGLDGSMRRNRELTLALRPEHNVAGNTPNFSEPPARPRVPVARIARPTGIQQTPARVKQAGQFRSARRLHRPRTRSHAWQL